MSSNQRESGSRANRPGGASSAFVKAAAEDGTLSIFSVKSLVPADLDPTTLPTWTGDIKDQFLKQFSIKESLTDPSNREPDANMEVREALCAIAASMSPDSAQTCRRFVVQTKKQDVGSMVVVQKALSADDVPIIECLWSYNKQADMAVDEAKYAQFAASVQYLIQNEVGGAVSCEIPTSETGVDLFHLLLRKNRARLAKSYVNSREARLPRGVKCSVLSPIPSSLPKTQSCAWCGKMTANLMKCARCHVVYYCGSECQRQDWRATHKASCQVGPPDDCVEVRVSKTGMDFPGLGIDVPPEWTTRLIPTNQSMLGKDEDRTKLPGTTNAPGPIPKKLLGTHVIVKVQVPMTLQAQNVGAPCVVYDKKRDFQICISPNNCDKYMDLCNAIRHHGVQGLKAYYRAWLPESHDGVMKIAYKSPLSAQPW